MNNLPQEKSQTSPTSRTSGSLQPVQPRGARRQPLWAAAAVAAVAAAFSATPAHAADVGVSIGISQPGVYGRVDIGRYPQPELFAPRPVIIQRGVPAAPPVYMWVPPEHRAHWSRYCGTYRACGAPVYFVRDEWYGRHVRPYGHGPGPRYEDRRYIQRDDHWDGRRDDHRGDDHRGDDHRGGDHRGPR